MRVSAQLFTKCSSLLRTNMHLGQTAHSTMETMLNNAYQNTVYLTHLTHLTGKGQIEKHFSRFGKVKDVAMFYDAETGLYGGFALVKFETLEAVTAAMQKKQHVIDDQVVNLELHVSLLNSKQKFNTM